MSKKSEKKEEIKKEKQVRDQISERLKDYLFRAHSFQEVGTEQLPDKDYDLLRFPHILFAAGVIMAIYGYFIIYITRVVELTEQSSAFFDGIIILIAGNVIATLGILWLLSKYWLSYLILIGIAVGMIFGMMALWDYAIVPWAKEGGFFTENLAGQGDFVERSALVVLTTMTFAYIACLVWFIAARYTSGLYFTLFARGKEAQYKYFMVDPWRKTLASKGALIGDILGRLYYPFFLLLTIILTLAESGDVFFIQIQWEDYFNSVLVMYLLLCAMVVLFPAFWLLDYVRYYDEARLEVQSLGRRVLILVKGYASIGTIFTFINRSQAGLETAIMEFFMLALYLIPALIVLIGGYVLLTERDVYYIADKMVHGDKVIIDYKLIDSSGDELKWWLGPKKEMEGGISNE